MPKVWLIEALAQKWERNKLAVEPTGTGSQLNLFSTLHCTESEALTRTVGPPWCQGF